MNLPEKRPLFVRRDHARIRTEAHATLYLQNNIKKGLKLEEISTRGALGLTDFPVKPGEKVEVLLFYPFFNEPVKKEATVVWCRSRNKDLWASGLDFGVDNKLDLNRYYELMQSEVKA